MRFEFENLGQMSVSEFEEFFQFVCRCLSLGAKYEAERGNREVSLTSWDGSVTGCFNSDYANGELEISARMTVHLAATIETFLRGKGSEPQVRVS